jgi:hypothetical protein
VLGLISVYVLTITYSAAYTPEVQVGENTPIGEVGGVTYLAMPHEPDPAGTSFEIKTKAENVYETIAELTVPAADTYYAGVSPDGKYFYVAGDNALLGSANDPYQFLYLYDAVKAERVIGWNGYIFDEFAWLAWLAFTWNNSKLYAITAIPFKTDLYEADPATGNMERLEIGFDNPIKFTADGQYVYYKEKGPDNSAAIEEFREMPGPYQLEPISCICCGGSGYEIYYRMDLATREIENAFEVSATSTLVEPGKPADFLGPEKAIDGDITTAWVEGADGAGVGESITIDFGGKLGVYGVGIFPGFGKDPRVYYGNNRVKKIRLEFSDGTKIVESFDDEVGLRIIDCSDYTDDDSIESEWLKLTILGVNEGLEWNDTPICEIAINPY